MKIEKNTVKVLENLYKKACFYTWKYNTSEFWYLYNEYDPRNFKNFYWKWIISNKKMKKICRKLYENIDLYLWMAIHWH